MARTREQHYPTKLIGYTARKLEDVVLERFVTVEINDFTSQASLNLFLQHHELTNEYFS